MTEGDNSKNKQWLTEKAHILKRSKTHGNKLKKAMVWEFFFKSCLCL